MFMILLSILALFTLVVLCIGFVHRANSGVCRCTTKLTGKTVLITGASAGLGKETAKALANRGARVILACRNVKKAQEVKQWILRTTGNNNVVVRQLDLSDLDSVRHFAKETLEKENRLDVLINNAGVYSSVRLETKQGLELTIGTNHFGHFLLTNLLLGLIKRSAPSRIINVSSLLHKNGTLDLNDLHFRNKKYSHFKAYSQSKLCNVLFTKELAHRLSGTGVTVNALHPGVVSTELINKEQTVLGFIIDLIGKGSFKTPELGAQTTIHLALSNEGGKVTGEYFGDCKITGSSSLSKDAGVAKKLWEFSEKEVDLKKEDINF